MKRLIATLLFTCIFTFAAHAQANNVATDRPGKSLDPATVTKKAIQFEIGLSKEFDKINGLKHEKYLYPTLLARYGLFKKIELRMLVENQVDYDYTPAKHKTTSGLEPVQFGFKYALLEGKGCIPQTSFVTSATLPKLASPDFKSNFVAPTFMLLLQNELSKKLSLTYNIGVEWKPDDVHVMYVYTISPGYEISENAKVFAEVYGLISATENPDHRIDAGFAYLITPNIQLDMLGGFGLTKSSVNKFIEAGFSMRLSQ